MNMHVGPNEETPPRSIYQYEYVQTESLGIHYIIIRVVEPYINHPMQSYHIPSYATVYILQLCRPALEYVGIQDPHIWPFTNDGTTAVGFLGTSF